MAETLYELTQEYRYLRDMLMNGDIDEQTFNDSLEGISFIGRLEEKASGYAAVDREMGAVIDVISNEVRRLTERKRLIEKRKNDLRKRLIEGLEEVELSKVDTPMFRIAIRNNAPSVQIEEHCELPNEYTRTKVVVEPDKVKIKEALESGEIIKGCSLARSKSLIIS